jgi:hypothetical protein
MAGLICVLSFTVQSRAMAHAFLDRAEPRVGSVVPAAPKEVKIWFTQEPEHAFSSIQVFDANDKEIDKADTHTDANDNKVLIVSLPELGAGTYKVVWHVLSIDTHRTQGEFKFSVARASSP